ncbi:MAG: hypothetical protein Q8M19_09750 [Reyranella sp.]|nr:hypothetical protein [Reyranella sp.]
MKLVTTDSGRVIQLFDSDATRSPRDIYFPQLYDLVGKRYGFLQHSDITEVAEKGAKFRTGKLDLEDGTIGIQHLEIYNDGIIATCRTTDEAEVVLQDAIEWATSTFGLRPPDELKPRTYQSWVIVDFERPMSAMIQKFKDIQSAIATSYAHAYGQHLDFETYRINFKVDPQTVPLHTPTEYVFDRRGGASYALERWFCGAPLKTIDHLGLLDKIEKMLSP